MEQWNVEILIQTLMLGVFNHYFLVQTEFIEHEFQHV